MSSKPKLHESTQQPWATAAAFLILFAVLGVWTWIEVTPPERVPPAPGQAVTLDKSAPAQERRKALIDKLIAGSLVRRIELSGGGTVRATLRPSFYALDEPTRREYAQIIYAYYFDGTSVNDVVVFRDSRNGNEVGRYSPYRGGLNMYK